eukprot:CAMPEP_0196725586 /NCGR_PEP_ID=MMETSP1091-20130531/7098_1 /TAXON_ID=302021 /ORGANISM="Rhodomonas sp., Strain CCMP768" /LENGTH=59 /DNA_ID=CAMNT_0042067885 /DNA_START=243 /DNA_END=422 /DNA_ORIENTATION=-
MGGRTRPGFPIPRRGLESVLQRLWERPEAEEVARQWQSERRRQVWARQVWADGVVAKAS